MNIESTSIPGCYVLQGRVLSDERGTFLKTFHETRFQEIGLRTDWREEYHSMSAVGVVRGLHFQRPPADHAKMVFCLTGEVLDVIVDLRRGSPAFGRALGVTLSADNGCGVYMPSGCAHGFVARAANSGMYYKVTSVHSPEHDAGIRWDSIDFDWSVRDPVLSDRDRRHPTFAEFDSPFQYDPAQATR